MSGMMPSFITGANAKIKIDSTTLAFATNVAYAVTVINAPVDVMGRYEMAGYEPLKHMVEGSFNIIRYSKFESGAAVPKGVNANGNGSGKVSNLNGTPISSNINPGDIMQSQSFDLYIYQKKQEQVLVAGEANTTNREITTKEYEIIVIKDCRITRKSSQLDKRNMLIDAYSFSAIMHREDSFINKASFDNNGDYI